MTREEQIAEAVRNIVEERQTSEGRKKYEGWNFADWFKEGIKWCDDNPISVYNLSDEDYMISQLEGIISQAERLTTGNLAHNKSSIMLMARSIKNICFKRRKEAGND